MCGQAGLLLLGRPLHHRRRLHLVDCCEPLRKVRVLLQGIALIWQRLLTISYVCVALRIDGGNIRLAEEVLSIVVLVSCSGWRLIVAHWIVASGRANIVDLDLVFLLELVNAGVESVHLPHVVLVQLVLILVVIVVANGIVTRPVSHPATKFTSEVHIGLSARLTQCSCRPSVIAKAIVARRAEATSVLVALLVLLRLVVHARLVMGVPGLIHIELVRLLVVAGQ